VTAAVPPVRVFFPCTGLGREQRGFEAFTRECADALRDDASVAMTVFGGGGALLDTERAVGNLPRRSLTARIVARVIGRDPYFVEQATFFAGFLPSLAAGRPDVVYFADLNLGNACWHWRRWSGQRFKLLYYNGGPTTQPFTRCDMVQQVSPEHLDAAVARGESAGRQLLLPHGLAIADELRIVDAAERGRIRNALGVPVSGRLILSVGVLNSSHKRMDAVIRAVALLPSPRPHLLLLGAGDDETAAVRALAARLLGDGCTVRSVTREAVTAAYRAADVFVLASLREGFGIAHLEALAAGLPCVSHESPTSAYLSGPFGFRGDLRDDAALAVLLSRALHEPRERSRAVEQHDWVRARFSWQRLAPRYAEMFHACAAGRLAALAGAS
jgi:glycosyltransferase involved in cell wall biosynthesis